jgi:integrase
MASLINQAGNRRVFFWLDGKHKSIRLGACSDTAAKRFVGNLEQLLSDRIGGTTDTTTATWLAKLPNDVHRKLSDLGLTTARIDPVAIAQSEADAEAAAAEAADAEAAAAQAVAAEAAANVVTIGGFIDGFLANRPTMKEHSRLNWIQVRQWLAKHFGETRDIQSIGPAEADGWWGFMLKSGLGENTARRHVGRARQLFKVATRHGKYSGVNPFEGMAATVRADKARQFFVTREMADKVIESTPDLQWKLLIALSRYGGLRCPSESLALKWADVDWEHNRIRVPSPKTEHHKGKESRMIPLFPELRKPLMDVFDEAEPGAEYVITRYREKYSNLGTQFERYIIKAGVKPWPKLWHNMRSTRETELAETYPIHVVCAWLGNTRAIAQEHYLQVTDPHFDRASQPVLQPVLPGHEGARKSTGADEPHPDLHAVSCGDTHLQTYQYPRQDSNL